MKQNNPHKYVPHNPLPQVGEVYEVTPSKKRGPGQKSFSLIVTHVTNGDPVRVFYKFPEDWKPETLQYAYSFATNIEQWEKTAHVRELVSRTTEPSAIKFIPFLKKAVNDVPEEDESK